MVRTKVKFVNAKDYPENPDAQCALWINERFVHHGFLWNKDGNAQCIAGDEIFNIKDNHIKSIVRRDYIELKGNYPGLSQIIDDIIAFKKYRAIRQGEKRQQFESLGDLTT